MIDNLIFDVKASNDRLMYYGDCIKSFEIYDEDRDYITIFIDVRFEEEGHTYADLAYIKLFIFDEWMSNERILEAGDEESCDSFNILNSFLNSEYRNEENPSRDCDFWGTSYSGIIDTFYVNPEYRENGIGKFILNNLNDILYFTKQYKIHFLVTFPRPFVTQKGNKVLDVDEYCDDEKMTQKMINVLLDAEFKRIGDTNCYIREYDF